ncbi:hypothetical protein BASA81_002453 [Batrachochytrium salamandrivorans]|nr:hypothetical protein BASA81_002453 [Batrachochytrium salamandrivorans]
MVASFRAWQWSFVGVLSTLIAGEVISYLRFKNKLAQLSAKPANSENESASTIVLASNKPRDDLVVQQALEAVLPQCQVEFDFDPEVSGEEEALQTARRLASRAQELAQTRNHKLMVGIGMFTTSHSSPTQIWVVINKNGRESFACSTSGVDKLLYPAATVARAWEQQLALF